MTRWPVHPVLVAAFPVLFLWQVNVREVEPGDVWPVLGVVVAAAVVLWVAVSAALRDVHRGALVTSIIAVAALSYGRVLGAVRPTVGLLIALGVVASLVVVVVRLREATGAVTAIVNVAAAVLVVSAVAPIAIAEATSSDGSLPTVAVPEQATADGNARDIWYVILDRYPRADTLVEVFDHDNTPFLSALEDDGFTIADHALANYPKTAHSLAASLNMTYLDHLSDLDVAGDDWGPVYGLLRDHRVGQLLTDAGYEYIHVGTWWSPTSSAVTADVTRRYDLRTEFTTVFETTTVLPAVEVVLGVEDPEPDLRTAKRNHSAWQLDELLRLARQPHQQPRFVFAHITLPHEPYVFEADGSFVSAETARARSRRQNFLPQLEYLNHRLRELTDVLRSAPDETAPIVILQSDEGPHPEARVAQGPGYRWDLAPLAEVREKLRILLATRWPGVPADTVPDDITPVNLFRLLFDTYLGTDLGMLPDRVYIFPNEARLYDFEDVTDRVRSN